MSDKIHSEAKRLLEEIQAGDKDVITNTLIDLGMKDIFIPVTIEFVNLAKKMNLHSIIDSLKKYLDMAYSPGLRAHILDDFVRNKVKIMTHLNELKSKHKIYALEQKLFMYREAEKMLRSTSTTGTTHYIMKIIEFRGDKVQNHDAEHHATHGHASQEHHNHEAHAQNHHHEQQHNHNADTHHHQEQQHNAPSNDKPN
jgi:RNAse (barnase) inhibitor barstar